MDLSVKRLSNFQFTSLKMINQKDTDVVLAVDLDGTLINTDTLYESIFLLIKHKIHYSFFLFYWFFLGKAKFKEKISQIVLIDASILPYNKQLINWLIELKSNGRKIILCTAADSRVASAVAKHLKIFDDVIASDGKVNNSNNQKKYNLNLRFGEKNYDYVGNSTDDIPVWQGARNAILVTSSERLIKKAKLIGNVSKIFSTAPITRIDLIHLFRFHQWLKNLLLFVPLLAAHLFDDVNSLASIFFAFLTFSMSASSVYMLNDLLDLESDRKHYRKKFRPFASGSVQIKFGLILIPLLIFVSSLVALYVGNVFFVWLLLYLISTTIYSISIKNKPLMDVFFLAYLYTLRVIARAAAIDLPQSFWLIAFSIFIFLSLAFVKRFVELNVEGVNTSMKIPGRGYYYSDAPIISILGVVAGYCSVVILALYVNSSSVLVFYKIPEFTWGAVLAVLYWINWVWFKAYQREMHDDPIVFAIKDSVSMCCLVVSFFCMYLAS